MTTWLYHVVWKIQAGRVFQGLGAADLRSRPDVSQRSQRSSARERLRWRSPANGGAATEPLVGENPVVVGCGVTPHLWYMIKLYIDDLGNIDDQYIIDYVYIYICLLTTDGLRHD